MSTAAIKANNNGVMNLLEDLNGQMAAQQYAQIAESSQQSSEFQKKFTLLRKEVAVDQAERVKVNVQAQRLLSSLAGKFSLISKIQQNLG